jgi:hypothetical protein
MARKLSGFFLLIVATVVFMIGLPFVVVGLWLGETGARMAGEE